MSAVSYGIGASNVNVGSGATLALWTGTSTTFNNPITLNGLGGTNDGYAKPAIYGDGGSGAFTLSGQITLAATSDIGNLYANSTLTINGRVTGPGGPGPRKSRAYPSAMNTARSRSQAGSPTITPATLRSTAAPCTWRKPAARLPFRGNVTINTSTTAASGSTCSSLICRLSIASTAVMNFSGIYGSQYAYFDLQGNSQAVAGINDTSGAGVIEHAEAENNITSNSSFSRQYDCRRQLLQRIPPRRQLRLRQHRHACPGENRFLQVDTRGTKRQRLYRRNHRQRRNASISATAPPTPFCPAMPPVYSGSTIAFNVAANTAITYPGVISSAGNFSKLGAGTLTISGAASNTYTGMTTFTAAPSICPRPTTPSRSLATSRLPTGPPELTLSWAATVRSLPPASSARRPDLLWRPRTERLSANPGRHHR